MTLNENVCIKKRTLLIVGTLMGVFILGFVINSVFQNLFQQKTSYRSRAAEQEPDGVSPVPTRAMEEISEGNGWLEVQDVMPKNYVFEGKIAVKDADPQNGRPCTEIGGNFEYFVKGARATLLRGSLGLYVPMINLETKVFDSDEQERKLNALKAYFDIKTINANTRSENDKVFIHNGTVSTPYSTCAGHTVDIYNGMRYVGPEVDNYNSDDYKILIYSSPNQAQEIKTCHSLPRNKVTTIFLPTTTNHVAIATGISEEGCN